MMLETKGASKFLNVSTAIDKNLNDVKQSYEDVEKASKRANSTLAATANTKTGTSFVRGGDAVRSYTSDIETLQNKLVELGATTTEVDRETQSFQRSLKASRRTGLAPDVNVSQVVQDFATRKQGKGNTLQQAGSFIFNAPSIPLPNVEFGTDTIGRFSRALGQLGVTIPQLGVAIAAVGAVIGVLVLGFDEARKEAARFNRVLENQINKRRELNQLAATNDIDIGDIDRQIRETRALLQNAFNDEQGTRAQLQAEQRAIRSTGFLGSDTDNIVLEAGAAIETVFAGTAGRLGQVFGGRAIGTINNYKDALDTATETTDRLEGELQALIDIRNSEAVQTSTQRIREEELADIRSNVLQIISQENFNLQAYRDRRDALLDERDNQELLAATYSDNVEIVTAAGETIRDINDELAILAEQGAIVATVTSALNLAERTVTAARQEQLKDIEQAISKNQEYANALKNVSLGSASNQIDALKIRRDAILAEIDDLEQLASVSETARASLIGYREELETINNDLDFYSGQAADRGLLNDLSGTTNQYTDAITSARAATAELRDSLQDDLADVASDLAETIAKAAQKRDDALADLQRKATQDRLKAEQDRNDKLAALDNDYFDKRRKILRDFSRSSLDAIANRDALALFQAKRRRDDELSDLDQATADRRKKINDAYTQQTQDIEQKLAERRRKILQDYNRRVRDAEQQAQRERAELNQAFREQFNALQTALTNELTLIRDSVNNKLAEYRRLSTTGTTLVGAFVNDTLRQLRGMSTSTPNTPNTNTGGFLGQAIQNLNNVFNISPVINQQNNRLPQQNIVRAVDDRLNQALSELERRITR